MAVAAPDRLYFTESDEANELIAHDPLALLIGFALDQQVTVQSAFSGPLKIKDRLGAPAAGDIASTDPDRLEEVFRQRPAIHRFPGAMATRVRELSAHVEGEYGGDAGRLWRGGGGRPAGRRRGRWRRADGSCRRTSRASTAATRRACGGRPATARSFDGGSRRCPASAR